MKHFIWSRFQQTFSDKLKHHIKCISIHGSLHTLTRRPYFRSLSELHDFETLESRHRWREVLTINTQKNEDWIGWMKKVSCMSSVADIFGARSRVTTAGVPCSFWKSECRMMHKYGFLRRVNGAVIFNGIRIMWHTVVLQSRQKILMTRNTLLTVQKPFRVFVELQPTV